MQAYPLDLVRTRLSAQTKSQYYTGIAHALRTIAREEGMFGLYRGLGATLLQVTPSLAINYTAYGTLRSHWLDLYGRESNTVSLPETPAPCKGSSVSDETPSSLHVPAEQQKRCHWTALVASRPISIPCPHSAQPSEVGLAARLCSCTPCILWRLQNTGRHA